MSDEQSGGQTVFTHVELMDLHAAHRMWCEMEGIADRQPQIELREKLLRALDRLGYRAD